MSLYLDTSVVIPLFVEEPSSDAVTDWIAAREEDLCLGDLVLTEFHAAISRFVRTERIDAMKAAEVRVALHGWTQGATRRIENLPVDIRVAGDLVCTPFPKLLAADAIHLATCRRLGITLATLDEDLQAIADREGVSWDAPE